MQTHMHVHTRTHEVIERGAITQSVHARKQVACKGEGAGRRALCERCRWTGGAVHSSRPARAGDSEWGLLEWGFVQGRWKRRAHDGQRSAAALHL